MCATRYRASPPRGAGPGCYNTPARARGGRGGGGEVWPAVRGVPQERAAQLGGGRGAPELNAHPEGVAGRGPATAAAGVLDGARPVDVDVSGGVGEEVENSHRRRRDHALHGEDVAGGSHDPNLAGPRQVEIRSCRCVHPTWSGRPERLPQRRGRHSRRSGGRGPCRASECVTSARR